MGIILVSTVLSSILLAGCTGENLKDIYLVSLSFSNNVSSASNATAPSNSNTTYLSTDDTRLELIDGAEKFKDEVVFKGLWIVSIILAIFTFLLLATFPGWHEEEDSEGSDREVKPFPSRPVTYLALACVLFSAIIALLAAFWQHMSSSAAVVMAGVFTRGDITGHVGAGAMALGWVLVSLLFLISLALLVFILSIWILLRIN
ncbi:hypothetical protein CKAH01_14478 [Colletotrichum kahawae]|uniref:Uncharacterized protein n=1 Tax=Colletotrichum kahawae TaxID=34407 RepID=A0AAD9YMA8_COLKA|nr:hypothetical protein CKAH01_14478 [Colletotrichum kahawae]